MSSRRKTVYAMALIVFVVGNGWCGDVRTAVVDMSRVMRMHPKTAPNRVILEREVKDFRAEQAKMLKDIESIRADFDTMRKDAMNKALSEKARAEKLAKAEELDVNVLDWDKFQNLIK